MVNHPDWLLQHKRPGTEIRHLNGRYYVYQITSVWNKEKKRADKKTIAFLGTITENGFIDKSQTYQKHLRKETKWRNKIAVKEFGASNMLISDIAVDITAKLQLYFPNMWQELVVISILRLIHQCPMKNVDYLYHDSHLSNKFPDLNITGTSISMLLRYMGAHRVEMVNFMKSFIAGSEHIIFDVTSFASHSDKLVINQPGYNSKRDFDPQINLLYVFSVDQQQPLYYRIAPGNVRDITAFKLGIKESELKSVIIIADKGFSSQTNIKLLQNENLGYIIPLRRNNLLIQYDLIKSGDYKKFDGYFMFKDRCIWHYSYQQDNQQLFTFIDEDLKQEESKDYLVRIDEEYSGYTQDNFFEKQHKFGTITVTVTPAYCNYNIVIVDNLYGLKAFIKNNELINELTTHTIIFIKNKKQLHIHYQDNNNAIMTKIIKANKELCATLSGEKFNHGTVKPIMASILQENEIQIALWDAKKVYYYLKNRMQIETSFDAYKNILHADITHMQNQHSLEAWMFINHLSLMYYYKIYQILLKSNMLNKYSPLDIIGLLLQIRTLRIDDSWVMAEIPQKISKLMIKLGIPITY